MILNALTLNIISFLVGVAIFYKFKFSFLRLFFLIILPKFFYIIFVSFQFEIYSPLIILKTTLESMGATLSTSILFAIIAEYLFCKLVDSKYMFLFYMALISILIFNLTPSYLFDYINNNKSLFQFSSIVYYTIDVIAVYIIYLLPNKLKNNRKDSN